MAADRSLIGGRPRMRAFGLCTATGCLIAASWQTAWGQAAPTAGQPAAGQQTANAPAYYTDPNTGIVYQKVHRTIERPVVTTEMATEESTVYRPETAVDVTPETRTLYTPVVSYGWEPRWRGRWNPFVQPTLEYQHVPRTHWEARNETIERRQTRTNWVAEKRRVEVPRQVMRIQREEKVDYQAVGRVAPVNPPAGASSVAQGQSMTAEEAAWVSRLQPLDRNSAITPLGQVASSANYGFQSGASTTLPLAASTRTRDQSGMRATELQSTGALYVHPLPPTGVARGPLQPWWR